VPAMGSRVKELRVAAAELVHFLHLSLSRLTFFAAQLKTETKRVKLVLITAPAKRRLPLSSARICKICAHLFSLLASAAGGPQTARVLSRDDLLLSAVQVQLVRSWLRLYWHSTWNSFKYSML
jgi:hypothetical protein